MKNTVKDDSIVIGFYNEGQKNAIQVGAYTAPSTLPLNTTKFMVGCGYSTTQKKNALECSSGQTTLTGNNNPIVYINYNFGLSNANTTTKAFVNAITPPQDPDNVTQDDQTLVTKSYLQTFTQYSLINSWDLSTAPVLPLDGTSYTLTNLPATAKQYLFVFRWGNQVYYNVVTPSDNSIMQLDHNRRAFSTFPEIIEYQQLRVDWDATHQTLTTVDYYFYNQDMANAGAISQWDHTLANAGDCKVLAVLALL